MHIVDHLFVFLLLIVQPIYGAVSYRNFLRKIEAGEPARPVKLYRDMIVVEWCAFAALAAAWYLLDRPVVHLGFVAPGGTGFYVGLLLLAVLLGFLVHSLRIVKRMTVDRRAKQIEDLGALVHVLPKNRREYRHFFGLSLTAGIVEEVVYRGFVIWYLAHYVPIWAAVVISSVIFGLGHSYQGAGGMLRTGLVGLGFGVLYVISGSIWLPIIGHALLDILQGRALLEILGGSKQVELAPD